MEQSKTLAARVKEKELVMAPGAFDALTARIIEAQGFDAVYMTGYGTCAALFGLPDLGLLTMTEMVQNASRMVDAVQVPVIADADTGYGNPMNVVRTVREYEKAGVAAIHLEDQVWPKRCGHMSGKRTIEAGQMVGKIKAAVDTRKSAQFLIIARTDAIATCGFENALERGRMYAEAGADVLFIEAPETMKQVSDIAATFRQTPLLINMAPRTPNLSAAELKKLGYCIVIYPGICLAATIAACMGELERLRSTGSQRNLEEWIQSFVQLNDFLGTARYADLERRYRSEGD